MRCHDGGLRTDGGTEEQQHSGWWSLRTVSRLTRRHPVVDREPADVKP